MPGPDELADAADSLTRVLTAAEVLVFQADQQGQQMTVSGSTATSAMPGNAQAFNVIMDAHAGVRRLEAELRLAVSGSVIGRGGSDRNTGSAIGAVIALAAAVDGAEAARALRDLNSWTHAGLLLHGIDEATRWLPIRLDPGAAPPLCPYCETPNLRLAEGGYVVRCCHWDCPGRKDGKPPQGRLDVSRLPPHGPVLVWADGLVQGPA